MICRMNTVRYIFIGLNLTIFLLVFVTESQADPEPGSQIIWSRGQENQALLSSGKIVFVERKELQLFDEIEKMQARLKQLKATGSISKAHAIAAAGVLGTIVYGLVHGQLAWLIDSRFYSDNINYPMGAWDTWINAVISSVVHTILPSVTVGALLGIANSGPETWPQMDIEEFAVPGVVAMVSALGLTLLGTNFFPGVNWFDSKSRIFPERMHLSATYFSVPATVISLFSYILWARSELAQERIDLEKRLSEARRLFRDLHEKADNEPGLNALPDRHI